MADTLPGTGAGSPNCVEIPGFYYDPEKKRYFKWTPQLREQVLAKQAERLRLQELAAAAGRDSRLLTSSVKGTADFQRLVLNRSMHCGTAAFLPEAFVSTVRSTMAACMQCAGPDRALKLSKANGQPLQLHIAEAPRSGRQPSVIVVVARKRNGAYSIEMSHKIAGPGHHFSHFKRLSIFSDQVTDSVLIPQRRCSSDMSGCDSYVIAYTTIGINSSSLCFESFTASKQGEQDEDQSQSRPVVKYSQRSALPNSCVYGANSKLVAVDLEDIVRLYDCKADQPRFYKSYSFSQNVCTIGFCQRHESLLYLGMRDGQVLCQDMRERQPGLCLEAGRVPPAASELASASAVAQPRLTRLVALYGSPHIITSYTDGQISKWDIRSKKVVCHYDGNVNDYRSIPFHIDETETFITSAGSDGYVRLWKMADGDHVGKFIPPCPGGREVPVVGFTSSFGPPLLLVGMEGNVYSYTYRGDDWLCPR